MPAKITTDRSGYLDDFLAAYIKCALWSSSDAPGDDDTPLDENYGPDDLAPEALDEMHGDCDDFIESNQVKLARADDEHGRGAESCGHDFWLTSNRHGAGFWDRGMGELGDILSDNCKPYGGQDLYVGDDGQLYVM